MAGTINSSSAPARGAQPATRELAHRLRPLSLRRQLDWRAATGMGTIHLQPAFQAGRRAKTKPDNPST